METPKIYFAPVPGQHRPTNPSCVYVRRPAQYSAGTAIKVEAYLYNGPTSVYWDADGAHETNFSDPIFTKFVWVSDDHRSFWDAKTEGKTGTTGKVEEYLKPNSSDIAKLLQAILEGAEAIMDTASVVRNVKLNG